MSKPKQTKIAKVRTLLQRPSGARLEAICKATGWQPHSARAAICRLRKAGDNIHRTPDDSKKGRSIYRILAATDAPS